MDHYPVPYPQYEIRNEEDERTFRPRPYGYGPRFFGGPFGGPFVGGLLGGLLGSAFFPPFYGGYYGGYYPPYYGRPFYPFGYW